jgi:hypothetical protein
MLANRVHTTATLLASELANRRILAQQAPSLAGPAAAEGAGAPAEQLLLVTVQLLANLSAASAEASDAVWEACWPSKWAQLTSPIHGGDQACCQLCARRQPLAAGVDDPYPWAAHVAKLAASSLAPGRPSRAPDHATMRLHLLLQTVCRQPPPWHCMWRAG